MIIDAFLFYNEIDMLKSRLQYLGEYVDKFIIIESTVDFAGQSKTINLTKEVISNLPFNEKVIHYIYEPSFLYKIILFPLANLINWRKMLWEIQHQQRDAILNELNGFPDDALIIFGDIDEFPNREELIGLNKIIETSKVYSVVQNMYYYNLEIKHKQEWPGTAICRLNTFRKITPSMIRHKRLDHIKKFTGWHFSYFMNSADIKNKIRIISGAEKLIQYNSMNTSQIARAIENGQDLFSRKDVTLIRSDVSEIPIELLHILKNNFQYLFEKSTESGKLVNQGLSS